jgi:hypothetical protein
MAKLLFNELLSLLDLVEQRQVATTEAEQLAVKHQMRYIEVSAKENGDGNVSSLFQLALNEYQPQVV